MEPDYLEIIAKGLSDEVEQDVEIEYSKSRVRCAVVEGDGGFEERVYRVFIARLHSY